MDTDLRIKSKRTALVYIQSEMVNRLHESKDYIKKELDKNALYLN